jgi:hypothetical protein
VIIIKANPGRVEEVSFTGGSPAERSIEAALWPLISEFVDRLDRRLRRVNHSVLVALDSQDPKK